MLLAIQNVPVIQHCVAYAAVILKLKEEIAKILHILSRM
jgi:hypothetical protein